LFASVTDAAEGVDDERGGRRVPTVVVAALNVPATSVFIRLISMSPIR
jgi:hypothetical protein